MVEGGIMPLAQSKDMWDIKQNIFNNDYTWSSNSPNPRPPNKAISDPHTMTPASHLMITMYMKESSMPIQRPLEKREPNEKKCNQLTNTKDETDYINFLTSL